MSVIGTDFSRRAYAVERRGSDWVRNHERPETASQCEGRTRDFGSLGECSIHEIRLKETHGFSHGRN